MINLQINHDVTNKEVTFLFRDGEECRKVGMMEGLLYRLLTGDDYPQEYVAPSEGAEDEGQYCVT
jgi:hypothetical protein